jgi:hypothetical protein
MVTQIMEAGPDAHRSSMFKEKISTVSLFTETKSLSHQTDAEIMK